MVQIDQTGLEEFSFGDAPEDTFYILINKNISPEGLDLEKLKLSDPRNFDAVLNEMGCIVMLNGNEVNELKRRSVLDDKSLHKSIYKLAKREGLIK